MKYGRIIITAVGLFALSGATGTARDQNGITLYTSAITGTSFHCNAVNVGRKTLRIIISVIGADGVALFVSDPTQFPSGTEVSGDFETKPKADGSPNPTDGYCQYQVLGTDERADLRAILNANLLRNIPGTTTPIFLSRVLDAR
jgi:hypothetical protein